ncbi:MAG: hypothetical protein AB7E27_04260 [Candidatus Methanomethylophilaceae archaeon]
MSGVDFRRMYCPRCERHIPPEKLEEKKEILQREFGKDDLERGLCPVCGTELVAVRWKE